MEKIDKAAKVKRMCEQYWLKNEKNCSGLVKDVAASLGLEIIGVANDIVDQFARKPWIICKDGIEARQKALEGEFVVGGLKAITNGHVVVVVSGPLAQGKYPTAYWGSLGGVGKKNTTINWAWNKAHRDKVVYAYRSFK